VSIAPQSWPVGKITIVKSGNMLLNGALPATEWHLRFQRH
jgi:hypothetical protein